jgi:hypothetical protein
MNMTNLIKQNFQVACIAIALFLVSAVAADAAALRITPDTGVYQVGNTFTARVQIATQGQSVNAAEGTIKFNPNELSVVSVTRSGSIFNLWVTEPAFSNSAGTVNFSGGVPTGYSGSVGNVLSITFRVTNAGSPRVTFTDGSVLANDGRGTNVLTSMTGGSYTAQAASAAPVAEVIEYVAPANTPAAPQINSDTHPDPANWSNETTAELSWTLPAGITAVRTLLDDRSSTVPTNVYDNPISSISLDDLPEGVSYFHLQFRNADGWGRITHYRLAVDSVGPANIAITTASTTDETNPQQVLQVTTDEEGSGVVRYLVKINEAEPFEFIDEAGAGLITLPVLKPGYHAIIVEAFDAAGNSTIGTYSITVDAFEKPVFTDIPTSMTANVIPVIRGLTRPNSLVTVFFNRIGNEPNVIEVTADAEGVFTYIPEGELYSGVYEISAEATDTYGAQSARSDSKRIAVQEPGYVRIAGQFVDAMSVIVPLLLLAVLLVLGMWYLLFVFRRFKGSVRVESVEALDILHREFSNLQVILRNQESTLQSSRKAKKLTKAESEMIEVIDKALQTSQRTVEKEIQDVTQLTKE